jgi:hypothetical protein
MRITRFTAASLLLVAGWSGLAQAIPDSADHRDKMVAVGPEGAAGDWDGQPWWIALADCAAAYREPPIDQPKFKNFGAAAMSRLAADRALPARQAAEIVMPYINGQGRERAQVMVGIFGGSEEIRSICDKALAHYEKL